MTTIFLITCTVVIMVCLIMSLCVAASGPTPVPAPTVEIVDLPPSKPIIITSVSPIEMGRAQARKALCLGVTPATELMARGLANNGWHPEYKAGWVEVCAKRIEGIPC